MPQLKYDAFGGYFEEMRKSSSIKKDETVKDIISGETIQRVGAHKIFTDIADNKFSYTLHSLHCVEGEHDRLGSIYAINPEVLIKAGMTESLVNGVFWSPSIFSNNYEEYAQYKVGAQAATDEDLYKYGEKSRTFLLTEGKKYTFGVELEFSRSYLAPHLQRKYNMKCMRDGSLNNKQGGPEYVTGILKGDSGIKHLQDICKELAKRSTIDEFCSIHVHIGGFIPTKEFIIMSYILGCKLEDELFMMLPPSRRKNPYCRSLRNKKLDFSNLNINDKMEMSDLYLKLHHWLACREVPKVRARAVGLELVGEPVFGDNKVIRNRMIGISKNDPHPLGPKCGYDHSTPRYCWLNLIPCIFNVKGNQNYTMEFRNHSGSSNFSKIFNWIKICMAFVYYVENYGSKIISENITIYDILKACYPKTHKSLYDYVKDRMHKFTKSAGEFEDYTEKDTEKAKTIKELYETIQ